MGKRYRVDFYDAFDGWIGNDSDEFDDLEEAKKVCDKKNAKLGFGNKACGEHYGVIDMQTGIEVYCKKEGF